MSEVMRWKISTMVTSIPTWPDVSTGGNKVDVSAPRSKRPTYTASAASLNNKPAVLFNNKELKGDISGALDILGQHIFVVASME